MQVYNFKVTVYDNVGNKYKYLRYPDKYSVKQIIKELEELNIINYKITLERKYDKNKTTIM